MEPTKKSENEALFDRLDQVTQASVLTVSNGVEQAQVLVVPSGKVVHPVKKFLDEYLVSPERRKGTSRLTTLESFVAAVNYHKDGASALFATGTELLAVFNYHGSPIVMGEVKASSSIGARWCDHRAVYSFPFSSEWNAWTAKTGKAIAQKEFGEFIEDRLADVLDPAAAGDKALAYASRLGFKLATQQEILTLSRGLAINADVRVKSAQNLSSGEMQVVFEETHANATGGQLVIPGGFVIAIPIFEGGDMYMLPVRLKYRLNKESGSVAWTLQIQDKDKALKTAIDEACAAAVAATKLPLYYGTPEV